MPMIMVRDTEKAFWQYKEKIKNITFEYEINIPEDAEESWDVSAYNNGLVIAYIKTNKEDSNYYDLYIQGKERIYANPNSSSMFSGFNYVDSINNIEVLNASMVTNRSVMFQGIGTNSKEFNLNLGANFDTSKVTDMSWMFERTGYYAKKFFLNLGRNFDTSNVTTMSAMFANTGNRSTSFDLKLGEKFNMSNVTNMTNMF